MPYSNKEKQREYHKKWYQLNKEKMAEYNQLNKEKRRENNRKWNEENKEKKRDQNIKWREENKEKKAECDRRYREENKEELREKRSEYYQLNNEKIREYKREKRKRWRSKCVEYLGGKCVKCGTTHNLQFDHIKRETKKYTIAPKLTIKFDNLKEELDKCQLLCVPCHLKKTAKEWVDITHNTVPLSKLNTMP